MRYFSELHLRLEMPAFLKGFQDKLSLEGRQFSIFYSLPRCGYGLPLPISRARARDGQGKQRGSHPGGGT